MKLFYISLFISFFTACRLPVNGQPDEGLVKDLFSKKEVYIPMRDGVKLFTAIYIPKDATASNTYPFLIERTPYGCQPYGKDAFPQRLGPNKILQKEKYIFVYQDVRGRYKSGGSFEEMTPAANQKKDKETDESSDTYDTVEWLTKNISGNNGKVGLYGISYPGFYATASLPNAHPSIKAVSPQAPVTDEFMGDDVNHNGAFFLLDNFSFTNYFGGKRTNDSTDYKSVFSSPTKDVYEYFLKLGPLKNTQGEKLYNNQVKIWNEYLQHDTYDSYWQARNIRTHLKNVKPAVLVVGGMFDAEDMFGAQRTFEAIEKQSKKNNNHLILGPWSHGAWARSEWTKFGQYNFGKNLNTSYQEWEAGFFNFFLKGKGKNSLPKATIFFTGTNEWKIFKKWPAENVKKQTWYLQSGNVLSTEAGKNNTAETYISNPATPVPYIHETMGRRKNEYLADDQRFAAKRADVLAYVSEPLSKNTTIAGPISIHLTAALDAVNSNKQQLLDADFIVKIIDILPDNAMPDNVKTNGLQRMVRAEVFRGKFRNSFEKPEGFVPGKKSEIKFDLNDAAHTFLKGHQLMVQVQSSWFPLVDRNPQKFMRIAEAEETDFQPVKVSVFSNESKIIIPILR